MENKITEHLCDRCGKKIESGSHLNISSKYENKNRVTFSVHVRILTQSVFRPFGAGEVDADLCKNCVVFLLRDALRRVNNGEKNTILSSEWPK